MNEMKGEKYISTAVDYSSLFSFNLCCIIMRPSPIWANSFFFILNLRLFSRKKQSKVTSLEMEENTDIKPHLCNMCGGILMDADNFTTHKEEHGDISLSIVNDLPQSIPQLTTILWWVPLCTCDCIWWWRDHTSNRWLEGQSRIIPKCVYNIEKVISPGNHVIQLHPTNAQYLDTKEAQIPQIDMPPIGKI